MQRRLVKAPFIAGFVALLYLLGASCLERVRGVAPVFGWPDAALRAAEILVIVFFAFISLLAVLILFRDGE
jgi:hypothetical protein